MPCACPPGNSNASNAAGSIAGYDSGARNAASLSNSSCAARAAALARSARPSTRNFRTPGIRRPADRKSVVSGRGVSIRGDHGGRRTINKKQEKRQSKKRQKKEEYKP